MGTAPFGGAREAPAPLSPRAARSAPAAPASVFAGGHGEGVSPAMAMLAADPVQGEDPAWRAQHDLVATVLETLLYVLTESPLQVAFEDVERLWASAREAGPAARDLVARCLSLAAGFTFAARVFGRPQWLVWEEPAYMRFFQEVLKSGARGDYRGQSLDGMVCFVNYMKLCNLRLFNSGLQSDMLCVPETPNCSGLSAGMGSAVGYSQLVSRDGLRPGSLAAAAGRRFCVARWGLDGYEELWELAMRVEDAEVFESCGDFLVSCSVFLHPRCDLYRRRSEVQTTFLQRCLGILQAPGEAEEGRRRTHKALALLAKLVHLARLGALRHQTSASWPLEADAAGERRLRGRLASAFHVAFRSSSLNGAVQQKTLYLHRSATIAALRAKVATALHMQPHETGLYFGSGNRALDWDLDCLTLEECQVSPSLFANLVRPARGAGGPAGPAWEMAEQDVDTLLDLLSAGAPGPGGEAAVWALLTCLCVHGSWVGPPRRVACWGVEVGLRAGQRPLAQMLAGGPRTGAAPAPAPARNAAEEFRDFWFAKVWLQDGDAEGQLQTHRLLYLLRVIHSLMLGGEEIEQGPHS